MGWRSLVAMVGLAGCGPSPQDVCDRASEVVAGCFSSFTTATASGDDEACTTQLESCSDEDLELMLDYWDCVDSQCDLFGDCAARLLGISSECSGLTAG